MRPLGRFHTADFKNMYYVGREKRVVVDGRILTLISIKRGDRNKRKRDGIEEVASSHSEARSEESPAFCHDPFKRLMKKDTDKDAEARMRETMSAVLQIRAWKNFLTGALEPEGGFSSTSTKREEFSKKVESQAEIEVSLVLSCMTMSKGLPPFFNFFRGHRLRYNSENRRYENHLVVDRVLGCTFREYLSSRDLTRLRDVRYQLQCVFVQVCLALSAAQKYVGFVHNDFHCENIMIQQQSDGDAMVFRTRERCFRFPEKTPRVRIIDYGQSSVVHPLHHRTIHSFTGLMTQGTHGMDLARFCMRIVRWAQEVARRTPFGGDWSTVLGDELTRDFCAVLRHVSTKSPPTPADIALHVASVNDNAEWYPFDVGDSPARVLREGACVRIFVVDTPREATCSFWRNLYVERPDDVFDSACASSRFRSIEKNALPVIRVPMPRHAVCDADKVVTNVYATLRPLMTKRGFFKISGTEAYDDSDNFTMKDNGVKKCRALFFQQTDARTRARAAWRSLVIFQKAVLLYVIVFVANDGEEAASIRKDLSACVGQNASRQHIEEILVALCCYANAGEFSFFEDVEIALLRKQENFFREAGDLASLRKKIVAMRDRVEFGETGKGGGLFVDAQKMTHEEVYKNECLKKLFYNSCCTCFYASSFTL